MKTHEHVVKSIVYSSDVVPEIVGAGEYDAEVIAWADAKPVVWKIVMGTRSKVFGKNASTYCGYERGDSPRGALARAGRFKTAIDDSGIFGWRARFTMDHYTDKGFRGGLFQQFDGTYDRGSMYLDYTPKTLDTVVNHFIEWCNLGYKFPTAAIKLDKKIIKTFKVKP